MDRIDFNNKIFLLLQWEMEQYARELEQYFNDVKQINQEADAE